MPTKQIYQEVLGIGAHNNTMTAGGRSSVDPSLTTSPSLNVTRPSSALDYADQGLRFGQRPKSTPHYGMKGHDHNSSPPSAKITRPKTAAGLLGRTECDRVHQLEHEATRRHNFENHLPLKKAKPPPWQKNLEPPLVPVVTAPGYILSRSKSKYAVTLKEDFFDYTPEETVSHTMRSHASTLDGPNRNNIRPTGVGKPFQAKKSHGDPERDALIAQLQQQVSDLSLYLEEERMNHKQTKQKAEEFLKDKVDQLTSEHQSHVRDLETEHKEELHKQKSDMEAEHKEYQITTEKQINRMVKEIEFLQGAFESYKSTLHSETWDKWKAREEDMGKQHSDDKQQALHDLKMKMLQERNQERTSSAKEHQRAMDTLRKQSKKEMDSLVKRFANAAADFERLKKTTAELEETKTDLVTVTQSYNETVHQLTNTTHQLTDAKLKLMDWEKRFQEKIVQVDDKYRNKLQELMSQNTELKRLFVQKCGELFNEKNQSENQTQKRVKTAKETMESIIKMRQRVDVNMAVGGPIHPNDKSQAKLGKGRPLSAPGTRQEADIAFVTAGEATKLEKGKSGTEEFISPFINLEPDPAVEEMREELLMSYRDVGGAGEGSV